jgi:hypothetical protein
MVSFDYRSQAFAIRRPFFTPAPILNGREQGLEAADRFL